MKPISIGLQMKKSGLKYHSVRMHQFSNKPKQSLFGNYVPPWYVKTLESESSINQINHPKPNIKQQQKNHTKVSFPVGKPAIQVC